MHARFTRFTQILPILLIAGCGVGNSAGTTPTATATKSTTPVAAKTASADNKNIKTAEVSLKGAYARLTANPGIVLRGGHSSLFLDVWSTDKKIKSVETRWSSSDGHLTHWVTRDRSVNGWWAPFNPFFQNSLIQARVHVEFEDGTDAKGTLQVSVWVQ